MEPIERLDRGIHRWWRQGREVIRCHFRADPDKDNEQYVQKVCSALGVSPSSPEYRTEMEIDPDAYRGEQVFAEYDEEIHVSTVLPQTGHSWWQVAGVDFGVTNPTAVVLGSWNGHRLRVWGLHYAATKPVAWHKQQVAHRLKPFVGVRSDQEAPDDIFARALRFTAGDPSGAGYITEYAQRPLPWVMITEMQGRRLNDPLAPEGAVKTLLSLNGACCGQIVYWSPCPACGEEVQLEPGLVIDSSCVELRHQFKTLRRVEAKEGLETPEKSVKTPDHAIDALKYLAFALTLMMRAPKEAEKVRPVVDSDGRRLYKEPERRLRSGLMSRYGAR